MTLEMFLVDVEGVGLGEKTDQAASERAQFAEAVERHRTELAG